MVDDQSWSHSIICLTRGLPADVAATAAFVVSTMLTVFLPVVDEKSLRILFGLPFLLFLPGYAFVAALFPGRALPGDGTERGNVEDGSKTEDNIDDRGRTRRFPAGIDGLERTALSFGLSVAVVPLIGLVLNFTPWGIQLAPLMVAVGVFTLIADGVAAVRRWQLPSEERFHVPYQNWSQRIRGALFEFDTRTDAVLTVVLVVSLLTASASVGYAIVVPGRDESFSEFYLLTENESGQFVADNYPANFTVDQPKPVVVGVENHEQTSTRYTVVVKLQRVRTVHNSTQVIRSEELDRFGTSWIDTNDTWRHKQPIRPTFAGGELRLQFLLYRGSAPPRASQSNAYREVHLWVTVSR